MAQNLSTSFAVSRLGFEIELLLLDSLSHCNLPMKQRFNSLARQVQLRVDRFGMKEWIVLIYFVLQPVIWQRSVDGFEYAWHLLQICTLFATADLAEYIVGVFQSQVESEQLLTRIREWGLLVTAAACLILLTQSVLVGL